MFNQARTHSLTRAAIESLYKYGLYGQRVVSKRVTRKYHGHELTERVFKRQLYNPRFNVVAGGSPDGKAMIWGGLYQGIERRLDTVIFRSLFATSIMQARQLVVHGHVEVNGKTVCCFLASSELTGRNLEQVYYFVQEIYTMPILN